MCACVRVITTIEYRRGFTGGCGRGWCSVLILFLFVCACQVRLRFLIRLRVCVCCVHSPRTMFEANPTHPILIAYKHTYRAISHT